MHLTNLIDLIAEVAAKRVAREGETKAEPPGEVAIDYRAIVALLWKGLPNKFHKGIV